MDNEISNGMSIAIEIIVLSAVIGFIMLFAAIGQQFQRSTETSVTDVVASADASEITALEEYTDPIPTADLYLTLERNADLVQTVSGNLTRRDWTVKAISNPEDLKEFFYTKVRVQITDTPQQKYNISVSDSPQD